MQVAARRELVRASRYACRSGSLLSLPVSSTSARVLFRLSPVLHHVSYPGQRDKSVKESTMAKSTCGGRQLVGVRQPWRRKPPRRCPLPVQAHAAPPAARASPRGAARCQFKPARRRSPHVGPESGCVAAHLAARHREHNRGASVNQQGGGEVHEACSARLDSAPLHATQPRGARFTRGFTRRAHAAAEAGAAARRGARLTRRGGVTPGAGVTARQQREAGVTARRAHGGCAGDQAWAAATIRCVALAAARQPAQTPAMRPLSLDPCH